MITIGVSFNLAKPPIIDLSSANFLGKDGATTEDIATWLSGPLLTIPGGGSSVSKITGPVKQVLDTINEYAPARFGMVECGIALKSPYRF